MDKNVNSFRVAPIALFVYNRPEYTRRTIEALRNNTLASESILHVFADGAKSGTSVEGLRRIAEIREIVSHVEGFKSVILHFSDTNKGCARSVREGVTEVVQQYGRVIVVEDDVLTIPQFLSYMNNALDVYAKDHRVWTIGGMNMDIQLPTKYTAKHDVYLVRRTCTWGWATWSDRWKDIDWEVRDADQFFANHKAMQRFDRGGEGMSQMLKDQVYEKLDSWAIVWDYHIYKHNGFCIYPVKSFTYNIGMDGSGTHYAVGDIPDSQAPLFNPDKDRLRLTPHLRPNREVQRIFYNYWGDIPKLSFSTTIKRIIKKILRQWGIMKQPQ
jgi:glycosyltransferase involved in cell wall biosynthesis